MAHRTISSLSLVNLASTLIRHPQCAGGGAATGLPHLLYLSYDDRAYLPLDSDCSWQDLRRQTELVISEAARSGRWRVTAKRHPQQRRGADWLDPAVGVATQRADTRQLVIEADVVVGFQTTTLLEAAAARRPVIYAAWGPVFDANHAQLIPYDKHPECVIHAAGSEHLAELLGRDPEALARPTIDADPFIAEHLGVIDGGATERVIHVLRSLAASTQPTAGAGVPASLLLESVGMVAALPFLAGAGAVLRRLGRADDRLVGLLPAHPVAPTGARGGDPDGRRRTPRVAGPNQVTQGSVGEFGRTGV